jgi:hypothetical protein
MSYTRYECSGETVEVIGVLPDRGLIATIDTTQGHRVTPTLPLTEGEWADIDVHLRFVLGLKKRARRAAMAARWGDSETFLEALYVLEDPRT